MAKHTKNKKTKLIKGNATLDPLTKQLGQKSAYQPHDTSSSLYLLGPRVPPSPTAKLELNRPTPI